MTPLTLPNLACPNQHNLPSSDQAGSLDPSPNSAGHFQSVTIHFQTMFIQNETVKKFANSCKNIFDQLFDQLQFDQSQLNQL